MAKFNPICKAERPFWITIGILIGCLLMFLFMYFISPVQPEADARPYYEMGIGVLLFLDDQRMPPPATRGMDVIRVETYKEFVQAVEEYKPSVIMLDHDLCIQHYKAYSSGEPYQGETGMDAALYLANMEDKSFVTSVLIHTMNDKRGPLMFEVLDGAFPDARVERVSWAELRNYSRAEIQDLF